MSNQAPELSEQEVIELLSDISGRISRATELALEAHRLKETDLAGDLEKIANDYLYLGRGIARGTWTAEAMEKEAKTLRTRMNMTEDFMEHVIEVIVNGDL